MVGIPLWQNLRIINTCSVIMPNVSVCIGTGLRLFIRDSAHTRTQAFIHPWANAKLFYRTPWGVLFLSGHLLMAGRVIMFKKTPNNHPFGWFPFTGDPAKFILWGEEKAQRLHLLQGNLIVDCRFRRARWHNVEIYCHKASLVQSVGNPIAAISALENSVNKAFKRLEKVVAGLILSSKYWMMQST